MEYFMKSKIMVTPYPNGLGVNINDEYLQHIRFADDIVLISDRADTAAYIFRNLQQACIKVGVISLIHQKLNL